MPIVIVGLLCTMVYTSIGVACYDYKKRNRDQILYK